MKGALVLEVLYRTFKSSKIRFSNVKLIELKVGLTDVTRVPIIALRSGKDFLSAAMLLLACCLL
jgi:hypothetical protein